MSKTDSTSWEGWAYCGDMARVPFTLRIDREERDALADLSKIEGRPVNQLLHEAIRFYLQRRGAKERSSENNLARLRAYGEKDPGFEKAITEFADAEAQLTDPLEGEVVDMSGSTPGPVQSRIRELLDAS